MTKELDQYFIDGEQAEAVWRQAGELPTQKDLETALDATIKKYADPHNLDYKLPKGTHFFLTDGKTHMVMWFDNGIITGVPKEQIIPVKKHSIAGLPRSD